MVAHAFSYGTWKADAKDLGEFEARPGPHRDFQDSQSHMVNGEALSQKPEPHKQAKINKRDKALARQNKDEMDKKMRAEILPTILET